MPVFFQKTRYFNVTSETPWNLHHFHVHLALGSHSPSVQQASGSKYSSAASTTTTSSTSGLMSMVLPSDELVSSSCTEGGRTDHITAHIQFPPVSTCPANILCGDFKQGKPNDPPGDPRDEQLLCG